jgi:drug/metabolite transporter (DMT)-like permease
MFIWVAFMAVPFLGERLGLIQVAAMGVLLGGQLLVAPPVGLGWGAGETMIATATLLWSIEVVIAKRLLKGVSAPLLASARMGLGVLFLVGYLAVTGRMGALASIGSEGWLWVLVTGGLLASYVGTWYGALRLAPASTVTSVLVAAAVMTGVLTTASKGVVPAPAVVAGYLLVLAGVALIAFVARAGSVRHGHGRLLRA